MSTDDVSISDIKVERASDSQELSALVDGERIWYRLPLELNVEARPEAFIAPALFEAMVRGVSLVVEDGSPVSRQLLDSLSDIQAILNCWNSDLQVVPVKAQATDQCPQSEIVASCFSGGIDSTYTYANYRRSITHFLLLEGFASGRGGPDDWHDNIEARRRFAQSEGKSLIAVHSNVTKFMAERDLSLLLTHGGVLCLLGAGLGVKQLLVPASYTARYLIPWGSHPILDPLWSTESTQVIHHGIAASRIQKTAEVAKHQALLDQIQVCWFAGATNCGQCGKCVRTSLALHLMGATSKSLPPFNDLRQLELLKTVDIQGLPFLNELIELAENEQALDISRRLKGYRRSYLLRKAASDLVREVVGVRGRAIVRRFRPHAWHTTRGSLQSVKVSSMGR